MGVRQRVATSAFIPWDRCSTFGGCVDRRGAQSDPLPSGNDGDAKKAILDFVAHTTAAGGADFVAAPECIAVFDNDSTLWTEQPIEREFAYDRQSHISTGSTRRSTRRRVANGPSST